ncbi:MAG: M23 family metallopeptidase [Clostridiales bacterium]|nr:M23 family metallopeptidase [Clostridiales bacterium]
MTYYEDNKNSKVKEFFKRKGLYIALFLCISAIGAGTWGVISSTVKAENKLKEKQTTAYSETTQKQTQEEQAVNKRVENEKDTRSETTTAETTTMESQDTNKPFESLYVYPVSGAVIKDYSDGELVYSKTMDDWRTHDGIDFQADKGTQVKAINDGIVLSVYSDALWGNVVEIDHGAGLVAKYCGLQSEAQVKAGDKVAINSVIGAVDVIPCEQDEGYHLHLTIEIGSTLVDPLEAMGKTEQ